MTDTIDLAVLRPIIRAGVAAAGLPDWMAWRSTDADADRVVWTSRRLTDDAWPAVINRNVWLEALIRQESGLRPRARRYERRLNKPDPRDGDVPEHDDGPLEDDASYGLMQILGSTARDYIGKPVVPGLWAASMSFAWLFRPMINVAIGCTHLAVLLNETDRDVARTLARYNMGWRGDHTMPDGSLRNQAYVDAVLNRVPEVFRA